MDPIIANSKLKQLELDHADEGLLVDIRRSDGLTTKMDEVGKGYFISPQLIGSITSIALALLYVTPTKFQHSYTSSLCAPAAVKPLGNRLGSNARIQLSRPTRLAPASNGV